MTEQARQLRFGIAKLSGCTDRTVEDVERQIQFLKRTREGPPVSKYFAKCPYCSQTKRGITGETSRREDWALLHGYPKEFTWPKHT